MSDTINYQGVKPSFEMGRVLNRTFSGLFKNIKYILAAIAIVFLISAALSAPMYFAGISDQAAPAISWLYLVTSILSLIAFFFFMMFISVFTDHLAFASFTNKKLGFKAPFLRSLKLALPVLFIVILYVIATYAGMILLIIPGVIISVGWIVIGPAYLHEDTSLFGSFGRSWQLTSGYKWWVWLATIVMGLIVTFFISVSAILISTLSLGQVSSEGFNVGFSTTGFLGSILFSLLIYLTLALYASFTTALYTELRELKEGPLAEEMSAVFD
jgi:hypothetical protein